MVSRPKDSVELHGATLEHDAYLSSSIVVGLTALAEGLVATLSGLLIHTLYVTGEPEKDSLYYVPILMFSLLMVQSFHTLGMYRFSRIILPYRQFVKIISTCLVLFLLMTAGAFALKISADFSRVWAFGWLGTTIVAVIGVRLGASAVVRHLAANGKFGRNIVIYGDGKQAGRLIRHIDGMREPWNRIVGVFDERVERSEAFAAGYPVLHGMDNMVDWCRSHRVDEVLITLPWGAQDRILQLVSALGALPVNLRLSPELTGHDLLLRRATNHFQVPMLSILEKPVAGWGALSKMLLDYFVAAVALLVLSPLLLIVALCIRLDSPGPILFRQKRYGFNNQLIEVYKFRSMYADQADANADKLATRDDPRVTKVGAFIRRYSIDELPQIINVLRGEMSIVGPRPHALHAKAGDLLYEDVIAEYAVRHKVKPGITGWAQVHGWRGETRDEAALLGRLEHDLYYIDNWSLLLDINIMFRTVATVFREENSY